MFDFNQQFFEKHQAKLLFAANRWYLRWLLGLNRLPEKLRGNRIDKITPNSIHSVRENVFTKKGKLKKQIIKAEFFTSPRFAEALAYNLSPFAYLMDYRQSRMAWRFSPVGVLGIFALFFSKGGFALFGTTTNYTCVSGDGTVYVGNATWATARSATTGTADATFIYFGADYAGGLYYIYRDFVPIDTSALDDGATISAASLFLYENLAWTGQTQELAITDQTQASNTALAAGDYDNLTLNSPTEYAARISTSSFPAVNNWLEIPFNNFAIVNKTGFTKIGIRTNKDIDNVAPATSRNYCQFNTVATAGTNDPYLSVTYTVGASSAIKTFNGLAYASTKTVNGLATASVKTSNGLA